jgi:hypothetical protein
MSARILLFVALIGVAVGPLTGCRRSRYLDTYVEAMNAEYRGLEDRYFDLQADYEARLAEIEQLKRRNANSRNTSSGRSLRDDDDLAPPSVPPDDEPPFDLRPPRIDAGGLSPPAVELPPSLDGTPPPPAATQPEAGKSTSRSPADKRVTRIVLNPTLSGGQNFDERPGDDGLSLMIEPRNRSNSIVTEAAHVVVVALDPQATGDQARVARWTVSPAQIADILATSPPSAGIHLKLAWPEKLPRHERLHVFVRYETADGRRLEANQEIEVDLPDSLSHRWTPRPPDRQRVRVARGEKRATAPAAPVSGPTAPIGPVPEPAVPKNSPAVPTSVPESPQWRPFR